MTYTNAQTSARSESLPKAARVLAVRRTLFWFLVILSVGWMARHCAHVLEGVEHALLRSGILLLFILCLTWIAVPFWTAVIGVFLTLFRLDPLRGEPERPLRQAAAKLQERTAVVMPVYNEAPERVLGAIAAMYDAVEADAPDAFDFFVLSDTRRSDLAEREEELVHLLRSEGRERLYYRRREENRGKKAGNIADFVTSWGGAYENMIVLDADSIMTSELLIKLAGLMETNPQAALIQTAPTVLNAETLFGRMIQFACRLCGPVITQGSVFLHGADANYWGHNAIVRLKPFAELCGLGTLPGNPPLGGEILSHDFVEAALLSAGNWGVYLLPDESGSYEELPPTPVEYLQRDQRWSQGNLQHLKLVGRPGFKWHSRLYFLLGGFAYLSSPLWFVLLILSTTDRVLARLYEHNYFPEPYQLFPQWPISRREDAVLLFAATLIVLFLPKVAAALLTLRDAERRRSFGGLFGMAAGIVLETIFFALFAPTMMIFHTWFVLQTLAGRKVQWNPQNRLSSGLSFPKALRIAFPLFTFGLLWGALLYWIDVGFLLWMSPIILGLVISPLLFWVSSSTRLGLAAKAGSLFLIPEELLTEGIVPEVNRQTERLNAFSGGQKKFHLQLPVKRAHPMPVNPIFLDREARKAGVLPQPALQS